MDNRKKNFVYMTEFFFFFIWKMLYCGEMTGGKSMNKKGYLHVYWKNCFDTYFFNMEYYKVYCEDLDRLLKKNIKDAEV